MKANVIKSLKMDHHTNNWYMRQNIFLIMSVKFRMKHFI